MKLLVGFITYGDLTAKYLPYFLPSLKNQTFKDFEIFVVDNSEDNENKNSRYIEKNYNNIEFEWAGENLGFAKANNLMIARAKKIDAEYILFLNPDMTLEVNAIEKMMQVIEGDEKIGSVGPKVLRWVFGATQQHPSKELQKKIKESGKNIKTKIIDTCGLILSPGLRFFDLGQARRDKGQFDDAEILGPSGCAALYRLDALKKVRFNNGEYFDELMFMYKEDCDLAYRLNLAGFKSKLAKNAIIYHDRTAKIQGKTGNLATVKNRKSKSGKIRTWSFVNQHIIFFRFWDKQTFKNKLAILWLAFKMFVFVFLFEKSLVGEYKKIWKLREKIRDKKYLFK